MLWSHIVQNLVGWVIDCIKHFEINMGFYCFFKKFPGCHTDPFAPIFYVWHKKSMRASDFAKTMQSVSRSMTQSTSGRESCSTARQIACIFSKWAKTAPVFLWLSLNDISEKYTIIKMWCIWAFHKNTAPSKNHLFGHYCGKYNLFSILCRSGIRQAKKDKNNSGRWEVEELGNENSQMGKENGVK